MKSKLPNGKSRNFVLHAIYENGAFVAPPPKPKGKVMKDKKGRVKKAKNGRPIYYRGPTRSASIRDYQSPIVAGKRIGKGVLQILKIEPNFNKNKEQRSATFAMRRKGSQKYYIYKASWVENPVPQWWIAEYNTEDGFEEYNNELDTYPKWFPYSVEMKAFDSVNHKSLFKKLALTTHKNDILDLDKIVFKKIKNNFYMYVKRRNGKLGKRVLISMYNNGIIETENDDIYFVMCGKLNWDFALQEDLDKNSMSVYYDKDGADITYSTQAVKIEKTKKLLVTDQKSGEKLIFNRKPYGFMQNELKLPEIHPLQRLAKFFTQ